MRSKFINRFYFESKEDRTKFYDLLKRYNLSVVDFAAKAGVSCSYFYNVLNGQKPVSDKLFKCMCNIFEYDMQFLELFGLYVR